MVYVFEISSSSEATTNSDVEIATDGPAAASWNIRAGRAPRGRRKYAYTQISEPVRLTPNLSKVLDNDYFLKIQAQSIEVSIFRCKQSCINDIFLFIFKIKIQLTCIFTLECSRASGARRPLPLSINPFKNRKYQKP